MSTLFQFMAARGSSGVGAARTALFVVGVAIALAEAVGCRGRASEGGASPSSSTPSSTAEASFSVEGMHCSTCPLTVKAAAEGIAGVKSAKVSMADETAVVTFDPNKTNPQAIATAITESGYRATPKTK